MTDNDIDDSVVAVVARLRRVMEILEGLRPVQNNSINCYSWYGPEALKNKGHSAQPSDNGDNGGASILNFSNSIDQYIPTTDPYQRASVHHCFCAVCGHIAVVCG